MSDLIIPVESLSDEELDKLNDAELLEYMKVKPVPELVIPNIPRELADHLVKLHNESLK